jgi:hypothetical protein
MRGKEPKHSGNTVGTLQVRGISLWFSTGVCHWPRRNHGSSGYRSRSLADEIEDTVCTLQVVGISLYFSTGVMHWAGRDHSASGYRCPSLAAFQRFSTVYAESDCVVY